MSNVIYTKFGIERDWSQFEKQTSTLAKEYLGGLSVDTREKITAELVNMTKAMVGPIGQTGPRLAMKPLSLSLPPGLSPEQIAAITREIELRLKSVIEDAMQQQHDYTLKRCAEAVFAHIWRALQLAAHE